VVVGTVSSVLESRVDPEGEGRVMAYMYSNLGNHCCSGQGNCAPVALVGEEGSKVVDTGRSQRERGTEGRLKLGETRRCCLLDIERRPRQWPIYKPYSLPFS
jgi:hypothetical protein